MSSDRAALPGLVFAVSLAVAIAAPAAAMADTGVGAGAGVPAGIGAPVAGDAPTIRIRRPALASPAALRRTRQRIADAALEVCGASRFSLAEMRAAVARSRCWHDSYADGIAQLDGGRATIALRAPEAAAGEP